MDGWLVIPNWPKWQSRRDRRDPWIKSYIDQLDRDEYLDLTLTERGLLHGLRLAYARADGTLRTRHIRSYIGLTPRQKHLDRLVEAGYIDILAAKPPPISGASAARAREEEEEEEEEEKEAPYPAQRGWGKLRDNGENPRALGTNPRAVAKRTLPERAARRWIANGLAAQIPDEHLEEVIADEFDIAEPELVAELAQEARKARRQ